ncbi:MAG: SMP-30/gluconolactonase/LRE family protein [Gemmatimonadaceae bacterium]
MKLTRRAAVGVVVVTAAACAPEKGKTADSAAAPAAGVAAGAESAGGAAAGGAAYAKVATIQGFKTPESVKYDSDLDVYFVSNINGNPSQKDGNGFISRVRPDGTVDSLHFIQGGERGVTLNAPKGLAIVGDTLVVADIDAVRMFNKRTGAPIASVELGRMKAHFLNDVAVGPDGALYVTDTGVQFGPTGQTSHPGPDQIFRIAGRTPTVAVADSALEGPNGIAWDQANGRFVVGSLAGKSLLTWKAGDAKAARLAEGPGEFDGVEVLGNGRVLASSWADSAVTLYDGGRATRVATNVPSPADIGVDTKRNRLLVPIFTGDRVEVFEIR